jgi:succinate dehydrogenase / fumarate reductase cytochrome b subunit
MPMTAVMSIAHRISGGALYVGVLLLAWFLIAASADAATFAVFSDFIGSFVGQIVLFLVTWALFHHLVGGLRHIVWDAGYGLDKPLRDQLAWATLIGGFSLAVLAWIIGYAVW